MTSLPQPVQEGVQGALRRLGLASELRSARPVAGGCINHGARVESDRGTYFLKWNASAPPKLFDAEADGLRALHGAGALRIPEPLARGGGSGSPSWLLMEWIQPGAAGADYDVLLGRGLARIHASVDPSAGYGWHHPNWIGSLPQSNRTEASWPTFWRDQRILPQLRSALEKGAFGMEGRRVLDRLVELVPEALADVDAEQVHLLHGDLWSGNVYAASGGAPVLIDPAVYRGHGEVDLAMTELFGGFGPSFYEAYAEAGAISEAYRSYRRELYQLYYLLVHVNLFGSQYERSSVDAARRVVAEVGT